MVTQEESRKEIIFEKRKMPPGFKGRTASIIAVFSAVMITAGAVVSVSAKEISITEINEFKGTNNTRTVYTISGGSVGEILDRERLDVGEKDKINIPIDREITSDEEIVIMRGKAITIVADGVESGAVVTKVNAHDALVEAGYVPTEEDEISVSNGTDLTNSDRIELVTVSIVEDKYEEEIPPETEYIHDASLTEGETRVIDEGQAGIREVREVTTYRSGAEFNKEIINGEIKQEPKKRRVAVGTKPSERVTPVFSAGTINVSDSAGTVNGMRYSRKITMTATAYSTSPSENGGYSVSAMGNPLGYGIAAVDPNIIPLGSRVYVTSADGSWNYGVASAEDTGGAIKGNIIDLCYEGSVSEVNMFGRRSCIVYILD